MILCLIKYIRQSSNHQGLTLTEMMIGLAFTLFLMAGVYGFYNTASQDYSSGVSGQNLQDGANIALSKIIAGETESGIVFRLSTAISYMIPNGGVNALYTCGGAAQAAPCNAANPFGELYYCQDSPCTNNDATARWYYLNKAGTSIVYHHPKNNGTVEETIYTAPAGSTLSLRFAPATSNGVVLPNVVEIDMDLAETMSPKITNKRLATSGDVSTFVLLRNHL